MGNDEKKPKGRRKVPLYIMMPPAERERVETFSARVERPMSWVVRDALRVYMDAVATTPAKLDALRAVKTPEVDLADVGKTPQPKRGRPPGFGKRLPRTLEADAADEKKGKPNVR